jgi:hypothetical protein
MLVKIGVESTPIFTISTRHSSTLLMKMVKVGENTGNQYSGEVPKSLLLPISVIVPISVLLLEYRLSVFLPILVSVLILVPKTSGTGIGTNTEIPVGKSREPLYRYQNTGFVGAPNSHPWYDGLHSTTPIDVTVNGGRLKFVMRLISTVWSSL